MVLSGLIGLKVEAAVRPQAQLGLGWHAVSPIFVLNFLLSISILRFKIVKLKVGGQSEEMYSYADHSSVFRTIFIPVL